MSIRDRLTIVYSGIFLGAFLVFTIVVYSFPRNFLLVEVDASLEEIASDVLEEARVLNRRDVYSLLVTRRTSNVFEQATTFVMVLDAEGQPLDKSSNLSEFDGALAPVSAGGGGDQFATETFDELALRVLTVPIRAESGAQDQLVGYLQVARAIEDYDTINRLLLIAVFIGLAAVSASTFVVTLVAPRLFQPLEDIATMARRISRADDLSRRLPDTGRKDEIGDLTMALNQTLGRLETLFRTQQRFLADVSHELRTPLTTIRGNVDLMRRMNMADPEFLNDIQAELERMTRLVNDLLLLARADVGSLPIDRRLVELDTLLLNVYRQLTTLPRPVDIVLQDVDQVAVLGDADRLRQLILNLADNAIKYTPAGGKVCLSLSKSDGWAHLEISDTGVGIPQADLAYIFDRFYRVDTGRTRALGGSGLGLSIVKWIAEVHGGSVEVVSEVGEGSTFRINLPLPASPQRKIDTEAEQLPEVPPVSDAARGSDADEMKAVPTPPENGRERDLLAPQQQPDAE